MKKKTAVLGATGSIGKSALDVLRHGKDDFEPVLFTAYKDVEGLLKLKKEFPEALLALTGTETLPSPEIDFIGANGLLEAIAGCGADIAINGIAGSAGLEPSLACLDAGMDLALANKETLVMAGPLIFERAKQNNVNIIPVDSEHSAIFKLIEAHGRKNVKEIILTASGGPFRNFSREKLKSVTPAEALAHPTWNMGPKITIDSASLANKGLEVIEAVRLFGFPPEAIKVCIHPQSIIHSMVRLKNGAVYAQMSKPDMRLPIYEALCFPETSPSPFGLLDFENLTLTFEKPDMERFPMLGLAYKACSLGLFHPAVYNAANEEAVEAFLKGKISFLEIPRIVGYVLDSDWPGADFDLGSVLEADMKARKKTRELIHEENKC
jgi:1-deoxy-D-xylulose-5-phosphate reductoisomerase